MARVDGIAVKKKHGQHFLRNDSVARTAVEESGIGEGSNVVEIGCGDGFLTQRILDAPIARLQVYEIDPEWVAHVRARIHDDRLNVIQENVLDVDLSALGEHGIWFLVANLPYQVTFPILHQLQRHRDVIRGGVIMVQEEVAQKLLKTRGRGYGYATLFFQHYFDWKLLTKVSPGSFLPPPRVNSRLLKFTVRDDRPTIPDEVQFWKFVKLLFQQPRRTIRNNLRQSQYTLDTIDERTQGLRAQQLDFAGIMEIWKRVQVKGETA